MLLKKGNRGKDVQTLQRALHLLDDGIFGQLTEDAVKEFQKSHGLNVDGIVGDKTWAAICGSSLIKSKRIINEIIVHCSATREGFDYTVNDITNWHKQRGFTTIGYHYVVYRDGSIHTGRDVNVAGAHCTGHNTHSIGVCYIGGCKADGRSPKDTRTPQQKESLAKLVVELCQKYNILRKNIYGHCEFAAKDCPCFDVKKEFRV